MYDVMSLFGYFVSVAERSRWLSRGVLQWKPLDSQFESNKRLLDVHVLRQCCLTVIVCQLSEEIVGLLSYVQLAFETIYCV